MNTQDRSYADRLQRLEFQRWKQPLRKVDPWGWNLRAMRPGFTLEVGCGIGRMLSHLKGRGVGVDHNEASVDVARSRGFRAYTPEEFEASEWAQGTLFDSLLFAHVLEHMTEPEAVALVAQYLRYIRPGGRLLIITPQEKGQASDATHVTFMDDERVARVVEGAGAVLERQRSFPLPRRAGRWFIYNEFIAEARRLPVPPA